MRKARRSLLLLLILVLGVVGAGGLWVWRTKRQYALNRQLIDALARHNNKAALILVQQGADPNTRWSASPAPTLPQLFRQLLHRSPPPTNHSPTALHLACGDMVAYYLRQNLTAPLPPEDVPLAQAMLRHGADVHATDNIKWTPLFYAILCKHPHTAQLLLDYGANVNAPDIMEMTPLMYTAEGNDGDTTRLLLEHGASVTLTNTEGSTALHYAIRGDADSRLIRLLLAHGADPNARSQYDKTPLLLAQQYHRSDLMRLLRGKR